MKHGRVAVLADPSEVTEEDHWRNLWSSKATDCSAGADDMEEEDKCVCAGGSVSASAEAWVQGVCATADLLVCVLD
jgi:hypothetical protein